MSTQLLTKLLLKRIKLCISASKRHVTFVVEDYKDTNRRKKCEYKTAASHHFDGLRLFCLFRTGSAPGGSLRFPMRWSTSCQSFI